MRGQDLPDPVVVPIPLHRAALTGQEGLDA